MKVFVIYFIEKFVDFGCFETNNMDATFRR